MRIDYEIGLKRLERLLTRIGLARSSNDFTIFADLKTGLLASVDEERRLAGLGPIEKMERKRILRELNRLTLQRLQVPFVDLCDVDNEPPVPVPLSKSSKDTELSEGGRSGTNASNNAHALLVGGYIDKGTPFAASPMAFERFRAPLEIAFTVEDRVIHIQPTRSPMPLTDNVRPLINERPAKVAMIQDHMRCWRIADVRHYIMNSNRRLAQRARYGAS